MIKVNCWAEIIQQCNILSGQYIWPMYFRNGRLIVKYIKNEILQTPNLVQIRKLKYPDRIKFCFLMYLMHCVKSVQIRSFFWSIFSCIRTEYGDLQKKNTDHKNFEDGHSSRSDDVRNTRIYGPLNGYWIIQSIYGNILTI